MVNEGIKGKEVRVIDADGSQLGIMSIKKAKEIALSKDLDLVNISPKASPPVCKIMDYGKYCFEISKKEKESRKNQKAVEIKEIRLSVNIGNHDFETKLNHAKKFLNGGQRIKVILKFKGREMMHINLGENLINKFIDGCSEVGSVEKRPKVEGRSLICYLVPRQAK